jgi:hypothetical protein
MNSSKPAERALAAKMRQFRGVMAYVYLFTPLKCMALLLAAAIFGERDYSK